MKFVQKDAASDVKASCQHSEDKRYHLFYLISRKRVSLGGKKINVNKPLRIKASSDNDNNVAPWSCHRSIKHTLVHKTKCNIQIRLNLLVQKGLFLSRQRSEIKCMKATFISKTVQQKGEDT